MSDILNLSSYVAFCKSKCCHHLWMCTVSRKIHEIKVALFTLAGFSGCLFCTCFVTSAWAKDELFASQMVEQNNSSSTGAMNVSTHAMELAVIRDLIHVIGWMGKTFSGTLETITPILTLLVLHSIRLPRSHLQWVAMVTPRESGEGFPAQLTNMAGRWIRSIQDTSDFKCPPLESKHSSRLRMAYLFYCHFELQIKTIKHGVGWGGVIAVPGGRRARVSRGQRQHVKHFATFSISLWQSVKANTGVHNSRHRTKKSVNGLKRKIEYTCRFE